MLVGLINGVGPNVRAELSKELRASIIDDLNIRVGNGTPANEMLEIIELDYQKEEIRKAASIGNNETVLAAKLPKSSKDHCINVGCMSFTVADVEAVLHWLGYYQGIYAKMAINTKRPTLNISKNRTVSHEPAAKTNTGRTIIRFHEANGGRIGSALETDIRRVAGILSRRRYVKPVTIKPIKKK